MRSRGGIPSVFPVLATFVAVIMAFLLTQVLPVSTYMFVTGQYHKPRPLSLLFLTPGRRCSPRKGSSCEEKRILLAAPVARAPRIRGGRLIAGWAWGCARTHRNRWPSAVAQFGGGLPDLHHPAGRAGSRTHRPHPSRSARP